MDCGSSYCTCISQVLLGELNFYNTTQGIKLLLIYIKEELVPVVSICPSYHKIPSMGQRFMCEFSQSQYILSYWSKSQKLSCILTRTIYDWLELRLHPLSKLLKLYSQIGPQNSEFSIQGLPSLQSHNQITHKRLENFFFSESTFILNK